MEIKKIYFDMDGVLADFVRGVHELASCDTTDDEYMWEQVKKVDGFFSKLHPIPGSIELINELVAKYGDKIEILTAAPKAKRGINHVAEDKTNWIRENVSDKIRVNIVTREEKPQYCQGPECILIDDQECNINNWQQAGGTGILFTSADEARQVLSVIESGDDVKVKFDTESSDLAFNWDMEIVGVSLDVSVRDYTRLLASAKKFKELSEDESVADIYKEVCDTIDETNIDYYLDNQDVLINSLSYINELNEIDEDLSKKQFSRYEVEELVRDPDRKVYFKGIDDKET